MIIIGVDPGVHKTAVAVVENTRLTWCKYGPLCDAVPTGSCDILVIEKPQVYQRRRQKGKQSDVVDVAVAAGAAAGLLSTKAAKIEFVLPRQWKGTVRKDIMTKRIYNKLDDSERELVDASAPLSLRHNVLDAVGIALWRVERL